MSEKFINLNQSFLNKAKEKFKDQPHIYEEVKMVLHETYNENLRSQENKLPHKKQNNHSDFLKQLTDNPNSVKEIVKSIGGEFEKRRRQSSFYKLGIALIIIIPISILSWKGILGTCETATLFGGIVGYVLGDMTN